MFTAVATRRLAPRLTTVATRTAVASSSRRSLTGGPAVLGDWSEDAAAQIAAKGDAAGVKFYLFNFVDLFGVPRSKMVPASAIKDIAADGAGFAGFAAWLDMTPAFSDVLVLPDPDSMTILPWKKEVAWLACNPMMGGVEVDQAPRNVLRKQNRALAEQGLHLITGVETEWHLVTPDGKGLADAADTQSKPCYDQVRPLCDVVTRQPPCSVFNVVVWLCVCVFLLCCAVLCCSERPDAPVRLHCGACGLPGGAGCEKRHFLRHLYIKFIFFPRQARDKHRKS
jgi:hypothetical protein